MILHVLFFLSGAAALLFETLWFRQAAVVFGNTVWASSIVLAAFMAGLAVGNWAATRFGRQITRPIRAYAVLELAVALGGLGLVWLLPHLAGLLAPVFRALVDSPSLLQGARVTLAFVLMVVPASAMGATLPIVIRALTAGGAGFGPALGALYGWNTFGAVAGALAGECFLIELVGLRGTGAVAAALDVLAAGLAWRISRARERAPAAAPALPARPRLDGRSCSLLGAAAGAGALLLALEIVWFRLLAHFVVQNSVAFALMLAVVLAGIAAGGWAAAAWLRRDVHAWHAAPAVALAASAATLLTYRLPDRLMGPDWGYGLREMAGCGLALMFPAALCSGILFTLLGRGLRERVGDDAVAAGWLTLANTLGAAGGAIAGGFLLMPQLGMELSIHRLGMTYAAVALAAWWGLRRRPLPFARLTAVAGAAGMIAAATFPSGLMESGYKARIARQWFGPGVEPVAWRETVLGTLFYTRRTLFSEPVSHRLLTNAYSMAKTDSPARRYMKQYVYWPVAFHPGPRRALLICFGLGSTAAALADTRELESIDVVDVSPEVLEMGRLAARPGRPYPLDDPRVRVHVEDGRFFLRTREQQYDVITGEPPPPKCPGVVSLYTAEYFRLVRSRLAPGGIATYWLPVFEMRAVEAASILKAFCDAFEDCSLWNGGGLNWMLAGSNGADYTVSAERLHRQWRDPQVAPEMAAVGFDTPAALLATYMADRPFLEEWAAGAPPLVDDFPHRLAPLPPTEDVRPGFRALMDAAASRERFETSAWRRRVHGAGLDDEMRRYFDLVDVLNRLTAAKNPDRFADLALMLQRASSPWMTLAALRTDPDEVAAAENAARRGVAKSAVPYLLALGAASRGDYATADRRLAEAQAEHPHVANLAQYRALFLCVQGRRREAGELIRQWPAGAPPLDPAFLEWARRDCAEAR